MSSTVRIPTQLRPLTEGRSEVSAEGATVAELIAQLDGRHPGLRGRLLDGLQTPVPEGAQVLIIPAVAGG